MTPTVTVADYLLSRLKQNHVEAIYGVPGDYNLTLLDYIEPQGIHWVGNCNELNAGYAADASARVKGLGALITTFGVGELSAVNAIAGAYAELAPVVHIVGSPARSKQAERAKVHHTFNDGDFQRFALMAKHITVAQTDLVDPRTCGQQIDTTILQCLLHSRPVYISLPADMVPVLIDATPLRTKLEIPRSIPSSDETTALKMVLDRLNKSERPMILVDGESRAYGIIEQLNKLSQITNWPTFVSSFGKDCIDESLPNFCGIWKGNFASKAEAEFVKDRDLILCFGPHWSNTNTYGYTSIPDSAVSILFGQTTVTIADEIFRDLPAKEFLSSVLGHLESSSNITRSDNAVMTNGLSSYSASSPSPNLALTQDYFYRVFDQYLKPGDIILAEVGTAGHGCREFHLRSNSLLIKPSTWLSIGYMLPATLGAGLAQRELHASGNWEAEGTPRTVLLIGDGSFQMTAQELSTIIKEKLNVLLVLINNDGYTVERCLHGYAEKYNDIARWNYLQAPALFGGSEQKDESGYHIRTYQARSWGELEAVMSKPDEDGPMLKMVEVFMDKEDAPVTLLVHLNKQKQAAAVK